MVFRCWRISWISKAILKQLLHRYWSSTLLVYLGYFDCFSTRQGLDLGVRYSRISFLCLFLTADIPSAADGQPILFQSIKKLPSWKKWYLMFASKKTPITIEISGLVTPAHVDGKCPTSPDHLSGVPCTSNLHYTTVSD